MPKETIPMYGQILTFKARVVIYHRRPTEQEETLKLGWEGNMQRDAWY
jgi:hypothetical protein